MTAVINSFLSYLLLVLVIVAIGGAAISLGIFFNKIKEKKMEAQTLVEPADTEE